MGSKDHLLKHVFSDFPGGPVVKNPPANEGDTGSIPGLGRSYMLPATKPMCRSYWAHVLQPLQAMHLESILCNSRSDRKEQHIHHSRVVPACCN